MAYYIFFLLLLSHLRLLLPTCTPSEVVHIYLSFAAVYSFPFSSSLTFLAQALFAQSTLELNVVQSKCFKSLVAFDVCEYENIDENVEEIYEDDDEDLKDLFE